MKKKIINEQKKIKETVINQIFYAKARSSFFIHNWAILLSLPLYFRSMQLYFFPNGPTMHVCNSSKELVVVFFHIYCWCLFLVFQIFRQF